MNVSAVVSHKTSSEPAATRQIARLATRTFQHVLDKAQESGSDARICTVERGDTLWGLCEARLGESGSTPTARDISAAVKRVADANGLADPNLILVGQQVDLSSLAASATPTVAPNVQASQRTSAPPPLVPRNPEALVTDARMKATEALASRGISDAASVIRSILRAKPVAPSAALSPAAATRAASPWSQVLDGKGRLTSEFGMRKDPFTGRPQHHNGIDIAAESGTAIHSYKTGQVTFSGWNAGYGKTVIVRHDDGTETVYSHAAKVLVEVGDQVGADDAIALVGSTGRSTGPHLHFELRKNGRAVDPVPLLTRELGARLESPTASKATIQGIDVARLTQALSPRPSRGGTFRPDPYR